MHLRSGPYQKTESIRGSTLKSAERNSTAYQPKRKITHQEPVTPSKHPRLEKIIDPGER